MIDWLSLSLDGSVLDTATREQLNGLSGHIVAVSADGSVDWTRPRRQSVRSDSHAITVEFGSYLRIYGSPAPLVTGRRDNVFGSLAIELCATRMLEFVERQLSINLPPVRCFSVTRADVTLNYHLGDRATVRSALAALRGADGGRYQVRTAGETVYWSTASTYRSGKAYAKGEHLRYLARRGRDLGLTHDDLDLADGLLRLELSLRRHYFSKLARKPWYSLTEGDLSTEHSRYFDRLVGSVEVYEMHNFEQSCIDAAVSLGLSQGRGKSAFMSWCMIQSLGFVTWRERVAKATYHSHKRILIQAGLSWADLCAGTVTPLRRRSIVLESCVTSWDQLRAAA